MKILLRVILMIILLVAVLLFIYLFVLKKKLNKEEIKYQLEEFKKSRALMGTLSIIVALILCFAITPAFTTALKGRIEAFEATKDIKAGEMITAQMIKKVEIGSYNLSNEIIIDDNELKNKYATTQILKGQYFYKNAVSENIPYEDEYLYTNLTGANRAISFTVRSLSYGLSNKLIKGDIVSLIVVDTQSRIETEQAIIPEELKYIEVLSTTNDDGKDIDTIDEKEDDNKMYQTITALVSDEQAKLIAKAETTKQIYVELVYRGNKKVTNYLLNRQQEILNILYPERVNDQVAKDIKDLITDNGDSEKTESEPFVFETIQIDIEKLREAINYEETSEIVESEINEEIIETTKENETEEIIIEKKATKSQIEETEKKEEIKETTKSLEQIQKEEYERISAEYGVK